MADVVRICTRADLGSCVVGSAVLAIASTEKAVLALRFAFAVYGMMPGTLSVNQ